MSACMHCSLNGAQSLYSDDDLLQVLISKEPTVAGRVAAHVAGLEDELDLLKQLDHPNIVRYLVRPPLPLLHIQHSIVTTLRLNVKGRNTCHCIANAVHNAHIVDRHAVRQVFSI